MGRDIKKKNKYRLEHPKESPVLADMAKAYFSSSPSLHEIAGSFLGKKKSAEKSSTYEGEESAADIKHRRAEARYRMLVEQIPAVTFMASLDEEMQELYVSPQIEGLLKFSADEWISDPIRWYYQIYPDDRLRISDEFARSCISGGSFKGEFRVFTRDKEVIWVHCESRLVRNEQGEPIFLQGVAFDITESKTAEERVKESLREKEILLKEVHHRVKNNLQTISSLLKLQTTGVTDQVVLQKFLDSEARVKSMALIHEKLYRSGDLEQIDFGGYVRDLLSYLFMSFGPKSKKIELKFDIEKISFGIDKAVPLGLILNELASNSLKHAFAEQERGEVYISLKEVEGCYELQVSDDGKGMPDNIRPESSSTLGLRLVTNLARQVNGQAHFVSQAKGTSWKIRFIQSG